MSKLRNTFQENFTSKERNVLLGSKTTLFRLNLLKGCIDSCMLVVFGWGKDENLTAVIHQVKTQMETKQETNCCEENDDSSDEGRLINKAPF